MQKLLALVFCIALPVAAHAQAVSGVVRDSTGAVVSGAAVILQSSTGVEQHAVTGNDGRFELARGIPSGDTLVVRAGGFAEKTVTPGSSNGELEIVLEPARFRDSVTVTPSRTEQRLGDEMPS